MLFILNIFTSKNVSNVFCLTNICDDFSKEFICVTHCVRVCLYDTLCQNQYHSFNGPQHIIQIVLDDGLNREQLRIIQCLLTKENSSVFQPWNNCYQSR